MILAVALLLAIPFAAKAQTPDTAAPSEAQVGEWFSEFQEVHQQLEVIQAAALQDPELNAAQEELGEEIQMAMLAVDPTLDQRMTRVHELESEALAAQQEGDSQRLQELMGEAQEIQAHFMSVQESALGRPEIADKLNAFQTRLEAVMIDIDPTAEALMIRFRELETMIEAAIAQGMI